MSTIENNTCQLHASARWLHANWHASDTPIHADSRQCTPMHTDARQCTLMHADAR